jgi:predicted acetyltransferase
MAITQRPLTDDDIDQAWALEREAFNAVDEHRVAWERWERALGLGRMEGVFLDGRLAAMAGAIPFAQWFGGRSIPMGGVRAVAVRPELRGRGYASRAVRAVIGAMRARGEALSALYPATVRPYRRLGWEIAGTLFYRDVPARALPPAPRDVPVRRAGLDDRALLRACYDRVARDTDGFVDRPDGRWTWWLERNEREHCYVATDEGYVIYRHLPIENVPDAFRLLVLDLVAATPRAFRALWGLLGDARSVVPSVVFRSAPNEPLAALLDGPDMVVRRERQWMLRLVDAAAAVAARGHRADAPGTVALDLDDPVCPWNAGRWTLHVADGAARLERGGDGAVRLGVGAFAALFSGWATTASLGRAGLLEGGRDEDRRTLDRVFAGPLPWMLDEF